MNSDQSNSKGLQLGKEYPQPGEEKVAADIVELLKDEMHRFYPPEKGVQQLRQIHPKMNGCVKAEFIIEPNLPADLKVGLFKESKTYPAWIRLSNGNTKPLPDYKPDFRGFAIKLMNVPGRKLDDIHPDITNQDFVLMNTKNFLSGDVKKFGDVLYVTTKPWNLSTIPKKLGIIVHNLPILAKAKKAKVKINHPCEIPYFSTVPFRFGDESRAVKYAVFPTNPEQFITPDTSSKDLLRINLAETLKKQSISFDFKIQFQENPVTMPIEDPEVIWTSEFIKLATINIPIQDCDTPERRKVGEDMAFNNWHCLPEHRPLGSFNRARKIIYEEMYASRHEQNKIMIHEAFAGPDFFSDTKLK